MEYWRKDYFRCCEKIIDNNPDKTPKDYLGELWKWVGQPLVSVVDPEINKDSRKKRMSAHYVPYYISTLYAPLLC
jgi:hypothetical protein